MLASVLALVYRVTGTFCWWEVVRYPVELVEVHESWPGHHGHQKEIIDVGETLWWEFHLHLRQLQLDEVNDSTRLVNNSKTTLIAEFVTLFK